LLSFARKRGWTVFATSQAPTRVHTGFRQLLTELVRVRPFSEGLVHVANLMDPDDGREVLPFYGWFNPRRARYDTRAEVRPLWVAGGGEGRRSRPARRPQRRNLAEDRPA